MDVPPPLYFIAIIPPEPVHSFAQNQKEYFSYRFNSKAALRSPPHITLHMPFRLKEKKEEMLIKKLKTVASDHEPFELDVNGFGNFEPRVIYLDITKPEKLAALQTNVGKIMRQEMNLLNANYKDQVFNPHLTVAFRDLKKTMFYRAWEEFKDKEYHVSFNVTNFSLLRHDGSKWRVYEAFQLHKKNG
ncbi:MAG: 2'-5' RNA ligase family protein [Bacteroidota bacterium]